MPSGQIPSATASAARRQKVRIFSEVPGSCRPGPSISVVAEVSPPARRRTIFRHASQSRVLAKAARVTSATDAVHFCCCLSRKTPDILLNLKPVIGLSVWQCGHLGKSTVIQRMASNMAQLAALHATIPSLRSRQQALARCPRKCIPRSCYQYDGKALYGFVACRAQDIQ